MKTSRWLRAAACTWIRSSLGPGVGLGTWFSWSLCAICKFSFSRISQRVGIKKGGEAGKGKGNSRIVDLSGLAVNFFDG